MCIVIKCFPKSAICALQIFRLTALQLIMIGTVGPSFYQLRWEGYSLVTESRLYLYLLIYVLTKNRQKNNKYIGTFFKRLRH